MNNIIKQIKKINIYKVGAIIVFIIIIGFSYLVGDLEDAPGIIVLGTAFSIFSFLILYGLGVLIDEIKNNNNKKL